MSELEKNIYMELMQISKMLEQRYSSYHSPILKIEISEEIYAELNAVYTRTYWSIHASHLQLFGYPVEVNPSINGFKIWVESSELK